MVTLNDCNGGADFFYDLEKSISLLEIGTDVFKIFKNKAPEKRHLSVKRWSRQIVWNKIGLSQKKTYEGIIDLRDVKDIRSGKNATNFELLSKLPIPKTEELDEDRCFVICYTRGFKIKTVCIYGRSSNFNYNETHLTVSYIKLINYVYNNLKAKFNKERDDWVKGLRNLTHDTINAFYPVQMERWLWKEFYRMTSEKENVNLKDVCAFLPQVNCQIPKIRLQEVFRNVNNRNVGELAFDEFASLCNTFTYDEKIFDFFFFKYSSGENTITFPNFKAFIAQQGDSKVFQDSDVLMAAYMRDFSRDPRQNTFADQDYEKGFFSDEEFVSYLFSRHNELLDPKEKMVNQDMTQPLSSYWIASSHNTYLTGDQIKSPSSCDAYARCLMRGCRCIELDCWDGADGIPSIYHGFTFTSKISFLDVVKTIKEYAFTTSAYPVILSIENHCSLAQQTKMAEIFEDIFGSMLLKLPIEVDDMKMLPSPRDLQGKIIVKNKKLPEKSNSCSSPGAYCPKNDSDNSCKEEGILYLRDKISGDWVSHLFVLNDTKMFYAKFQCTKNGPEQEEEEEDDDEEQNYVYQQIPEDVAEHELHYSEIWFHGHLNGGKNKSKELLEEYGPKLGDGTFLVRNSDSLIGDFTISFWYKEKVRNTRIKSRIIYSPSGKRKKDFQLTDGPFFDSICSLVEHYKTNPYKNSDFEICFDKPVPHLRTHLGKNWFHPNIGQTEAVELLLKIPKCGAFLVRPSDNDPESFTISFRTETEIKHCRIKQDGRLFMIGRAQFASLVDLIRHYETNPLYGQVHLHYPVMEESTQQDKENRQAGKEIPCSLEDSYSYMEPTAFTESMGISVKTLQSYKARKNDELSFPKDAIIKNVKKIDTDWWRGDYKTKIQGLFMAACTQEIDYAEAKRYEEEKSTDGIAKGLQKGDMYFDVTGATVVFSKMNRSTSQTQSDPEQTVDVGVIPKWLLLVKFPSQTEKLELGVESREDALNLVQAIRNVNGCETDTFDDQENNDTIQYSETEKKCRIARGLSDIIVYCQAQQFNQEVILRKGRNPCHISSFCETKAEKLLILQETQFFLWYHQVMLSRIYPVGLRIDSSNYNPVPFWNVGSQLVALNYQTPDRSMQLNEAMFLQNGKCGYVLKPSYLRKFSHEYNPSSFYSLADEHLVSFVVTVISARHLITRPTGLTANLSGVLSPYIEVEIIGCEEDMTNTNKHTTKVIPENGFNPFWNETFQFHVSRPSLAFLRFVVYDRDSFSDSRFVAQATYPLSCVRRGFRSVPLNNDFSEPLEMSCLLIFLDYNKQEDQDVM